MREEIEGAVARTIDGSALFSPRPLDEWHEDMGPVLWWVFPLSEPPYVGSPLDCGHTVEVRTQFPHVPHEAQDKVRDLTRIFVGGWPGYHTHWTPIPKPNDPS